MWVVVGTPDTLVKMNVSVGINRLPWQGDTPGSRHPGRMSENCGDAVTGGTRTRRCRRNPVGASAGCPGSGLCERLAATVTVRTRASVRLGSHTGDALCARAKVPEPGHIGKRPAAAATVPGE